MTEEERLVKMTKNLPKGHVPKHCKLAAKVMANLAKELERQGYKYLDDEYWPYHILVCNSPGRYVSFFCNGFRQDINVQQLKKDGTADCRFAESSFVTPKGAVNSLRYI